jgi:hypothetical protein
MAFDACRHERCPRLLAPLLFQFGVAWFWMALALEGRALGVWRDLKAQSAPEKRPRLASVWAGCAQDLRDTLFKGTGAGCPEVQAWSLPDSRRMRALGLGCIWAVMCPHCSEYHMHSPGEGRRTAHCSAGDTRHYTVAFAGALPLEHHTRFQHWVMAHLPRLVQQAGAHDQESPRAAEPLAA